MARTAPQAARFTIIGAWSNGRPMNTVLEMVVTPLAPATRAAALTAQAAEIGTQWEQDVCPVIGNNYTASRVDFVDLDSATGPTGSATGTLPATGGLAGATWSPGVARLVTKVLLSGGRGQRNGKVFLPPAEEVDISEDGVMNAPALARDQTALTNFLTGIQIVSGPGPIDFSELVVIQWPSITEQPPLRRVPDPDGVGVPEPVGSLLINPVVASMRRRQRG